MKNFTARVWEAVRRIPSGQVATYGEIAVLLSAPKAARGVGRALSGLPEGSDVPWWRVVNGRGETSLRGLGGHVQRLLLEQEGVRFGVRGRVDLARFGWRAGHPATREASPPVT